MTTSAVQQTSIVMPSDIDRRHHTDKSPHSVTGRGTVIKPLQEGKLSTDFSGASIAQIQLLSV